MPVTQKVLSKVEKTKLDRSKLLGSLLSNKVAEYSLEDERCHTGKVKEYHWSVLKDVKDGSKFLKALEKEKAPVE